MSLRFLVLLGVILAFAALSAAALLDVGYMGILTPHFRSWGGLQVFVDLVILAVLGCLWMVRDARARGLSAWPFIMITMFLGSFGPLSYLAFREWRGRASAE